MLSDATNLQKRSRGGSSSGCALQESPPKKADCAAALATTGGVASRCCADDLPREAMIEVLRFLAGHAELTGEWVGGDAAAAAAVVKQPVSAPATAAAAPAPAAPRTWCPAAVPSACKLWSVLANDKSIWSTIEPLTSMKAVNWGAYKNLGQISKGTEGTCFKVLERSSGRLIALKKSRVYPDGEGIPYYMMRELSFLMASRHPHIANIEKMNLHDFKLYCFFPLYETTLHDLVARGAAAHGAARRGTALDPATIQRFMFQLTDAVSFCHRRGVLHRNIKPKHVLVSYDASDVDESGAPRPSLKLSDFALMRTTSVPRRAYTAEVVTLWYRSPEVLLRDTYHAGIDMWALGCVFCEMIIGKPMFAGISEIDQLFQIFRALGVPDRKSWYNFDELPANGNDGVVDPAAAATAVLGAAAAEPIAMSCFPRWPRTDVWLQDFAQRGLDASGCALMKALLTPDPSRRFCAERALVDPYFAALRPCNAAAVSAAPWLSSSSSSSGGGGGGGGSGGSSTPRSLGAAAASSTSSTTTVAAVAATTVGGHHALTPIRFGSGGPSDALATIAAARIVDAVGDEATAYRQRIAVQHGGHALRLQQELRATETARGLLPDYMKRMASIAARDSTRDAPKAIHRALLVDWLIEVVDAYKMSRRTMFLAVSTFDRFLASKDIYIERKKMQLLGATCLHIASKVEDVSYIGVSDLCDSAAGGYVVCSLSLSFSHTRNLTHSPPPPPPLNFYSLSLSLSLSLSHPPSRYTKDEVLDLEEIVLNTLEFKLAMPNRTSSRTTTHRTLIHSNSLTHSITTLFFPQ